MASQSLGSLFVTLDAKTTGLVKGLSQASGMVDKFTKEVKKLAADVSQTATAITALGVASVAMSAQVDSRTNASLTRVTKSMQVLATQVADILGPAMKTLGDTFRRAADALASLDPETRKQLASWAVLAVQIGLAAKVVGVVIGLVNGLAGAFEFVFAIIAGVGVGTFFALIAAVALVGVAVVVLHKAWRENWGGMQEIAGKVAEWFANTWQSAIAFVTRAFGNFVDTLASMSKAALGIMATIADQTGNGAAGAAIRVAMGVVDSIAKDLKSGATAKKFVAASLELGKKAATSLVEEFKKIAARLGLSDVFDKIMNAWNNPTATARTPTKAKDSKALGDWYGAESERINKLHTNRLGDGNPGSLVGGGRGMSDDFAAMAAKAQAQADQAAQAMGDAMLGTAQAFINKLGKVGQIANDVIQAARSGGPWAALLAAFVGLLMETEPFAKLVEQMGGGLKVMTDALEPAAGNLLGAIGNVLAPVFGAIAQAITAISPVLNVVAQVLNSVAPLFVLLGYFLQMLMPLINFVVVILQPVIDVFTAVVRVLFEVARVIFTVVGAIATGVVAVWNGLMDAIAAVVDTVIAIVTLGAVTNAGAFARNMKASTAGFDAGLQAMTLTSYDAAMASSVKAAADQRAAGAADSAAKSLETFSESFLNVPSGYKVSSARYASTAESGMGYGGSGGGQAPIIIGSVQVSAKDPAAFLRALEEMRREEYFSQTGRVLTSTGGPVAGSVGALR